MNYAVIIFLMVTNQFIKDTLSSRPPRFMRNQGWIWSQGGGGEPIKTTTQKLVQPEFKTGPCAPYNPRKPNFRAKHRISDAKCLEHIWDIKVEQEKIKKENECVKYSDLKVPFILGGHFTKPGEYPHMGAVGWRAIVGTWIFKCGSTLISPKFMLTAAHCSLSVTDSNVANQNPEIVRLGDKNIIDMFSNGSQPIDAKILQIITHPSFRSPKKYNDIAIIELVDKVTFSVFVQPACLWTKALVNIQKKPTITGWGVIETAGRTVSPQLLAAEIDLINSTYCDQLLRPACNRLWCGMESHQLCAGKLAGGVDACQGDSGGPLQVKIVLPFKTELSLHYIIGITSFGIGCARKNMPGVYTRVSTFADWIEKIVWKD